MPRQTLIIRLDGVTAGDYIAHVTDPEPPALGCGLRSVALSAEPLGETVHARLDWDECVPQPRVAAAAAGLRLTAEVVAVEEVAEVHELPAPAPVREHEKPGRLTAMIDRAAAGLVGRPWTPSIAPPLQLRWA